MIESKDIPSDIKDTYTGPKRECSKVNQKNWMLLLVMQTGDQGKLSTIFQAAGALAGAGAEQLPLGRVPQLFANTSRGENSRMLSLNLDKGN